jgi:hypothetical protein
MNIIKNLFGKAAFAALLTTGLLGALATPAAAHETDCPYCKLKVVQDTKEMDNEVLLRYGNKRIEYRCVMCAIAQAKTKYKDKDLTIIAPSTVKGKPVTITKKGSEWTASPAGAMFVFQKGNHSECQDLYRAALTHEAAVAWANKKNYKQAQHLSLKELVAASK